MKSYAFAGASSRAISMFAIPIARRFHDTARIAGVFDVNPHRARLLSEQTTHPPIFDDFDAMLRQTKPDCVIVTTVDRYHHEYIIRALEAGCDAITEKPMTIDAEKCRAILEAERRSGRTVIVTFNYRFMPYVTLAKEIIRSGALGSILNVDFEWVLDRRHGADYFRRWHRRMENSGGLLVHKSTHHFDLVNWWLDDDPERVFAFGARRFYGPTRAERGERCSTCDYARACEFYVDYAGDPTMKALYFDAEHYDGYFRDRCVFSDEIDIYDTMSVCVRYAGGAQLAYSLVAYSPYEGWRISFTGTRGRMELEEIESGPLAGRQPKTIKCFDAQGKLTVHEVTVTEDGHGGGDSRLLERLFGGKPMPDPLGHMAGSRAGAMSILIGIGANQSIASGQAVNIADLLGG
ncbi:MAG: Gfo/Idh/MocA family oxidoreductase [Anaerolineae bacterium]|nr:Gfo/Idh/MocA family oxidoreductase [Anaerolineae bacterium]